MQRVLPKTLILVLVLPLVWGAGVSSLRAQTFSAPLQVTGPSPTDFEFRADGTLIAKGVIGTGSLLSTDQGAGARLLWYPARAAFRAGNVPANSAAWDLANIGQGSVAFGLGTTASGAGSSAFGLGTASGATSTAFGFGTASGTTSTASGSGKASGFYSTAFGYKTTASGDYTTKMGTFTTASGYAATALGFLSLASGDSSLSVGYSTTASGNRAIAFGDSTLASGNSAFSAGYSTTASGNYATTFGAYTTATAVASFAVGSYNVGGGDPYNLAPSDPLFEVGNGNYQTKSDALVVYRNGSANFQGVVTVAPGGDIPMYTGN